MSLINPFRNAGHPYAIYVLCRGEGGSSSLDSPNACLTLRKGGSSLHVAYADTYTNNLYGYDARVRIRPTVEISLDLNRNLRGKNKSENGYIDARELADGEIDQLEVVQICDERVIDRLAEAVEMADNPASEWGLTIELEGQHKFRVRPDADRSDSLFLRVIRP